MKLKVIISYFKKFISLHFPEQIWIITHLFKASEAYKISELVLKIANDHISDPVLDGDYSGGMVDAFRHCLWMAMLTRRFGAKFARSLGKVHEKSNYIDYKKRLLEEDKLPDFPATKMDLLNNEVGIYIGKKYMKLSDDELIAKVKDFVLNGYCWKIKKDENGNYLNIYNEIIDKREWEGKWFTPKVLVPSDFKVFSLK